MTFASQERIDEIEKTERVKSDALPFRFGVQGLIGEFDVNEYTLTSPADNEKILIANPRRVYLSFACPVATAGRFKPSAFPAGGVSGFTLPTNSLPLRFHWAECAALISREWFCFGFAAATIYIVETIWSPKR